MSFAAKKKQLKIFLKNFDIEKTDVELLEMALTHPSFNYENNEENMPDYERLEFLGDSVLRLVMSEDLYDKYPNYDEGKLTKIRSYLVSDEFLAKLANEIGLAPFIKMGVHEEKDGGRKKESILACAMEAVFGAVFKSLGFDVAKNFICNVYSKINVDVSMVLFMYNSKELLQQYTQGKTKSLPEYELVEEFGQAHDKTYIVSVSYQGDVLGSGEAKTKKEAEKIAAFNALKKLNIVKE
ncbi:MAG: ribonuclease III [Cyanobacteria bacterium SIG29]|nr:ribonuclease III [Cyanobacteria bacterium SIG29]